MTQEKIDLEFAEFCDENVPESMGSYEFDLICKAYLAGRKAIEDRRCDGCKHYFSVNKFTGECDEATEHRKIFPTPDFSCKYWEEKNENQKTKTRILGDE